MFSCIVLACEDREPESSELLVDLFLELDISTWRVRSYAPSVSLTRRHRMLHAGIDAHRFVLGGVLLLPRYIIMVDYKFSPIVSAKIDCIVPGRLEISAVSMHTGEIVAVHTYSRPRREIGSA